MKYIFNLITYFFYKIYCWKSRQLTELDAAVLASGILSAFITMNIVTLWGLLYILKVVHFFPRSDHMLFAIFTIGPILLISYFLFIYKKKYLQIFLKYSEESKKRKYIGTIIVIMYMLGSFILLGIITFIKKKLFA